MADEIKDDAVLTEEESLDVAAEEAGEEAVVDEVPEEAAEEVEVEEVPEVEEVKEDVPSFL